MALVWGREEMDPPKGAQLGGCIERYKFEWPVGFIDAWADVSFRSVTAVALGLQDWADLLKIELNGLLAFSFMRRMKLLRSGFKRATDEH